VVTSVGIETATQDFSQRRAAQELRRYALEIERARNQRLLASHLRVSPTKWFTVFMLLFVSACVTVELNCRHKSVQYASMAQFSQRSCATLFLIAAYDATILGRSNIEPSSLTMMLLKG